MIRKMLLCWVLALAVASAGPVAAQDKGGLALVKAQAAQTSVAALADKARNSDVILTNPVVFSRPANLKGFKTDAGMAVTMRSSALFDGTGVQCTFSNWHNLDDAEPALPITVKLSIADPFNNIYPARFVGADANGYVTIAPGANATNMPIGVTVRAGEKWKLRWNVIPASGGSYPVSVDTATGAVGFAGIDQVTTNTATDYTATQTQPSPSASDALIYAPTACTARPIGTARHPTVMLVGDSTMLGFGDNPGSAMGTLGKDAGEAQRALQAVGIGHINFGVGGYTAQKMAANMRAREHKMEFASSVTDAFVRFGTNDLFSGRTFLQIQADLLTIWNALADRGVRVWALTVTPRTNTSGVWTAGGVASEQSAYSAGFGPEVAGAPSEWKKLNDWIKTVPAPLAGVFDVDAAYVTFNTTNQTYVWSDGMTLDGTHYNAAGAAAGATKIDTSKVLRRPATGALRARDLPPWWQDGRINPAYRARDVVAG